MTTAPSPAAPPSPTTAPPPTRWPTGIPSWMEAELATLSAQGDLFGVPPAALASVAKGESGYEAAGAGVNPQGYGGFFGLPETQPITTPSGPITLTAALLETPSQQSFMAQAEVAAGRLSTLATNTEQGTLIRAMNAYGNGPGTLPTGSSGAAVTTVDTQVYQTTVLGGATTEPIGAPTVTTGILTWISPAWDAGRAATSLFHHGAGAVGQAFSGALGGLWSNMQPFLARVLIVGAGVGLIVLAAYKMAAPPGAAKHAAQTASEGALL